MARYGRVHIDVGTGDGRAVLRAAARDPGTLVIGLDAAAPSMASASRRAARPVQRGGQPNALFVVAAVETPPSELIGLADLVTVTMPWGSLLRGALGLDEPALRGLAALARTGGRLDVLLSVEERDRLPDRRAALDPARIEAAWAGVGFELADIRTASASDVAAAGSSWAKRLAGGLERRTITRLRLVKSSHQDGSGSIAGDARPFAP